MGLTGRPGRAGTHPARLTQRDQREPSGACLDEPIALRTAYPSHRTRRVFQTLRRWVRFREPRRQPTETRTGQVHREGRSGSFAQERKCPIAVENIVGPQAASNFCSWTLQWTHEASRVFASIGAKDFDSSRVPARSILSSHPGLSSVSMTTPYRCSHSPSHWSRYQIWSSSGIAPKPAVAV